MRNADEERVFKAQLKLNRLFYSKPHPVPSPGIGSIKAILPEFCIY
jgi:hypothetical protein